MILKDLSRPLLGALFLTSLGLTGCSRTGGNMTVTFPNEQTLQFEAQLTRDSDFALDGQLLLPPYGDLYFLPANPQRGFTFGGRLDLKAFLPEGWEFAEVMQLPTGAFFPPFIQSPLVQVPLAENQFAYLGVRDQKILGLAWSFITSDATPIGIGANYYDDQGNIVMGGVFYPPVRSNGEITQPGGLFIATNLTPFIQLNTELGTEAPFPLTVTFGGSELKVRTYAIENGRTRELTRSDLKVAESYQRALREALKTSPLGR